MSEENEAVSTSRLNFNATAETPVVNEAPATEEAFTPPAFLQSQAASVEPTQELDAASDTVATEATVEAPAVAPVETVADEAVADTAAEVPVDGSQADLNATVASELTAHAEGTGVAPEVIQEQAPAAVADVVAAAVDNTAINALSSSEGSVEDLQAQQEAIAKKIAEQKEANKAAVLAQVVEVVKTYNLTVQEVVDALGGLKSKRVGSKAKMKYRSADGTKEWSGRGKAPLWIRDEADKTRFLITG